MKNEQDIRRIWITVEGKQGVGKTRAITDIVSALRVRHPYQLSQPKVGVYSYKGKNSFMDYKDCFCTRSAVLKRNDNIVIVEKQTI